MVAPIRRDSWPLGVNNLAPRDRLPEGAVRSAVNVDANVGGTFTLRQDAERIYEGQDVRGALALGNKVLIADGTDLVEFDLNTNSHRIIRQIAGGGAFVGDVHAGLLYFCTSTECLVYDGAGVRSWGVPDAYAQPAVMIDGVGGLVAGYYQIAVTYTDAAGREGGTDKPLIISVPESSRLSVIIDQPPTGCTANLYCSSPNGKTLYLQGRFSEAATTNISIVRDDTERLTTDLLRSPEPGDHVLSFRGVLLVARGNVLWRTEPMRPHLVDRVSGFFQFPAEIGALMADAAVFVSADKCYAIDGIETPQPSQRTVLDVPAIPGTATRLPDGRAVCMTRYGQAISVDGAGLQLVNRNAFAVPDHESGAAGVLEHGGNQMIVTAAKGGSPNGLAMSDYFFGEILNR
jgi:hypothetical protein